jgi:hypothetical protein
MNYSKEEVEKMIETMRRNGELLTPKNDTVNLI